MEELLDAVVDLVALVSPTKIRSIANAFRNIGTSNPAQSVETLAGTPAARAALRLVIEARKNATVSGDEICGMLLGASEARHRVESELSVELVWTGPTTRFVPTRRTEQVLLDLIHAAKKDLFLVSFVAYVVPNVMTALSEAISRKVKVRVLLEASTNRGGTLAIDPAAIMSTHVPGVEIYTWKEKEEPFIDGKVHAKVAVVDGKRAFFTSANLTGHALEKNMEAGVLVNGGPVPKSLNDHLQSLIDVGVISLA